MSIFNKFLQKKDSQGIKSAVVYVWANLISRGLAIVTVPIFTRLMTTDEIGIVNLYTSSFSLIYIISTLSLSSGCFALAMKEYETKRNEYISSIITLTSLTAIGYMLMVTFTGNIITQFTGLSPRLLKLIGIGLLVNPAMDFWLARQRYEYKYKRAAITTILSALIASICSIIAVQYAAVRNYNTAEWRLFANYFVLYLVNGILWISQLLKGKTFINKTFWSFSLKLSLPLMGYDIAAQILNVSDRFMINNMVGPGAVGIYSTLYTVSSISIMIWNSLNASFVPFLFENIDKYESRVRKIANRLLELYAGVALLLTYFAPEIVKILATREYYESIFIMPPIAAGVFFISVANIYSNILVYYKKTIYIMYSSVLAAVLNISLNYVFIPQFGYMAAAYTTLFSYIVMAICIVIFVIKVFYKKRKSKFKVYDNKYIFLLCIIVTGLTLLALMFYRFNWMRYLSIIVVGIAIIVKEKKIN